MKFDYKKIYLANRKKIKFLAELFRSASDFAITKSPATLFSGIISGIQSAFDISAHSTRTFFKPSEGWERMFDNQKFNALFEKVLMDLPHEKLEFNYESAAVYTLSNGEQIVSMQDAYTDDLDLFVKKQHKNAAKLFLVEMLIKDLGSGNLSIYDSGNLENPTPKISVFTPSCKESELLNKLKIKITKFFSKKENRSIIFYGLPGVGKTTLAESLTSSLALKTLKFKPLKSINPINLLELLEFLNIEAVIIDDFDLVSPDENILFLLEKINQKVPLLIAIANSLDDFHPAILRPGRFDEKILISSVDSLEHKELVNMLPISAEQKLIVEKWPLAFAIELRKYWKCIPEELEIKFQELNERFESLLKSLSEKDLKDDDEE